MKLFQNYSRNFSEIDHHNFSTLKSYHNETTLNFTSTLVNIEIPDSTHSLALNAILGVFCVTFPAIGVPTCILIVSAIATFKELRTYQNAFVASLILRDMLIIGVFLPIFYADLMLGFYPFVDEVCTFQVSIAFSISLGSVMELMNIAISRYVKICCNVGTYRRVYNRRTTASFIFMTWMFSFLIGLSVSIKGAVLDNTTHICFIPKSPLKAGVTSVILATAVAVTLFCYINIYRTVREAKENLRRFNEGPRRQRTVNHTFQTFLRDFLVFIFYTFLLLPFILLNSFGLSRPGSLAWEFAKLTSFTNNFSNCVIYGLLNRQIRDRFIRLLICVRLRKRNNVITPYTITVTGVSRTAHSVCTNNNGTFRSYTITSYLGKTINNNNNQTTI